MNANEYYLKSRGEDGSKTLTSDGSYLHPSGVSYRLFNFLARAEFTITDDRGRAGDVDWQKVRAAVLDGTIWSVRGVGEKYVMALCEVLASKDLD